MTVANKCYLTWQVFMASRNMMKIKNYNVITKLKQELPLRRVAIVKAAVELKMSRGHYS